MKMRVVSMMIVLISAGVLLAQSDVEKRLNAAATVFSEIMQTPDKAIPQKLLDRSQCVVVIPGMKGGAFIFGAKYGKGFLSCRKKSGVGWTSPGEPGKREQPGGPRLLAA
jgi:lipid-binding SYLF domain-containing protein